MFKFELSTKEKAQNKALCLIKEKKAQGKFIVLDVGGASDSGGNWAKDVVDYVVDIQKPNFSVNFVSGDINEPDVWQELATVLEEKVDFCICSHTLEDICNPQYVCKQISKIAKSGFISVPSKYQELCPGEGGGLVRGWFHHRWIFTIKNNEFVGLPKLNIIDEPKEKIFYDNLASKSFENPNLSLFWTDKIELKIINSDMLSLNRYLLTNLYKETLS